MHSQYFPCPGDNWRINRFPLVLDSASIFPERGFVSDQQASGAVDIFTGGRELFIHNRNLARVNAKTAAQAQLTPTPNGGAKCNGVAVIRNRSNSPTASLIQRS